ncbi:uncharacterized protein G2W53_021910 [Senna tora]|uniref:Uncharacterized protein n=1 Tax=Senna tora TaxID=362788 RepID=A0A834TMR4_9FABA|nr:uncharacterized protein G2W53_021910 [Senna tora]
MPRSGITRDSTSASAAGILTVDPG